jgi:YVTN family beta-propeller protein
MSRYLLFATLVAAVLFATPRSQAQQPYHVLDHWTIGGTGGWDYLLADPGAHRLYVTHGTRVEVLDTNTGKIVATIDGFKGLHGIALDPNGKIGYLSDGGSNAVVVFDRSTNTKLDTIPTGGVNPDGITYEPVTKTVWAFNGRSKSVTVIDTATRKVAFTTALPGKPEFPVADGHGNVFDNIEDQSELVRLDAHTGKVTAVWPLAGCDSPSGLALDRQHMRLFSVCDNNVMAITDARTGKQLGKAPIGKGPDAARFDPARNLAFSSNGDGTLTIVNAASNSYPVLETLPTKRGARTMALDPRTDRLYLVTADFGPPPAPTADRPHPRPAALPGSFTVLVVGR